MDRKISFFEKILLLVGIFAAIIGFYLIDSVYSGSGRILDFDMLQSVFLWILLLFIIVITALSEHQKLETAQISNELHKETMLMREMIKDQVVEIKLLRSDLSELHKIEQDLHPKSSSKKKKA